MLVYKIHSASVRFFKVAGKHAYGIAFSILNKVYCKVNSKHFSCFQHIHMYRITVKYSSDSVRI